MKINVFIMITPLFLFIPQGIRWIGQDCYIDKGISLMPTNVSQNDF
jgi:hypothetical protein